MCSKEILFAAIFAIVTCRVTAEGNACATKDSSGVSNPLVIMGEYLGNTGLLDSYLSRFRSHPYMKSFNKHVREDAVSENIMVALLALETAVTTSRFLGKKVDDVCDIVQGIFLAMEYEKDHDINKLLCAVDNVMASSQIALESVKEYFLLESGCDYKAKAIAPPACNHNRKCIGDGFPTGWEGLYQIVNRTSNINGVPAHPKMFESLKQLLEYNDRNLWGVAITWFGVQLHMDWLFKAKMNVDPKVFSLAVKILQYMEVFAFSKDCSCKQRYALVSSVGDRLNNAIIDEMTLLKVMLKKNVH